MFRIFDALNDVEQMRPAIEAVRDTGTAVAEVALCYTGDLSDPGEKLYTLDYYLGLAERIVDAGAHVLAIKDMAGLLRAPAARTLVTALRERFDLPVHLHTHDTPGGQLATLLAAIDAGVDAVDARVRVDGRHHLPAGAVRAGRRHRPLRRARPGCRCEAVCDLEPYWEATRRVYAPFESGLASPTGRVYTHEIPGGQLSNLRQQAIALGLGEKFEQIEDMYAAANDILGNIVKVTPSSKVVGDLALHLVAVGADPAEFAEDPGKFDVPDSVIGFLSGELGDPPGGWPEPFRTKALAGRTVKPALSRARPTSSAGASTTDRRLTLNALLFPGPTKEFAESREKYGDISVLPTVDYLYGLRAGEEHEVELEEGKTAAVRAAGDQRARRARHPHGDVHDQRPAAADQRARPSVAADAAAAEKADPGNPGHVAAPFEGVVTHQRGRGRRGRGRRDGRDDRGDEDGGLDHRPHGRHRRAGRPAGTQQVEGGDLVLVL